MQDNIYIVIPSLNPDKKLKNTVEGMLKIGFKHILLVDDGSDSGHKIYFPKENESITVLTHKTNLGKGAALKTAFNYILENIPDADGVITVDGDGQHTPEDALKCAEALEKNSEAVILGCRDFSGKDVPKRSSFGNKTTSLVFKALCGISVSDTQTGLRAFPRSVLSELIKIKGERFEYETNMLLVLSRKGISFKEVKISTVYLEENASSHFRPIRDSVRIYHFILSFFMSSAISTVIDIVLFYILSRALSASLGTATVLAATVLARAVSSFTNYIINKQKVFGAEKNQNSFLKYYALAVPQMLVSALIVTILKSIFTAGSFACTILKMIVDTVLFFISYRIQNCWVFTDRRKKLMEKFSKEPVKLTLKTVIGRILLSLTTALAALLITVITACIMITHGPSESLKNMLVISAEQASATKWVPYLFLSKKSVKEIMKASETISTDVVKADDYNTSADGGEWADSDNGVKLEFIKESKFKAYVCLIKDPKRVKVGVSSENFEVATVGKSIFDIVGKYNCLAAINGGEFSDIGGNGSGAAPMGLTYSFGKCVWNDGLRRTFMGFDKNDRLICRDSVSKAEADKLGIRDAVCFQTGNVLISQNGDDIKLYYGDSNTGTAQRTAIGQRADGTVILLVTDGRSADSIGATRNDVIDIMVKYKAVNAGMLDGGSSAMLYYKDYQTKYGLDKASLDSFQQKGLVNRYKAFVAPRTIPTFFIVTEE